MTDFLQRFITGANYSATWAYFYDILWREKQIYERIAGYGHFSEKASDVGLVSLGRISDDFYSYGDLFVFLCLCVLFIIFSFYLWILEALHVSFHEEAVPEVHMASLPCNFVDFTKLVHV